MSTVAELLSLAREHARSFHRIGEPLFAPFRAALVLLASVEVGQNVDRLARLTGLDRGFVAQCARRLIDNGVWENGVVIGTWTAGDPLADVTFWYDVAVAEGRLLRQRGRGGELEWAAPGEWVKDYSLVTPGPGALRTIYYPRGAAEPPPGGGPEIRTLPTGEPTRASDSPHLRGRNVRPPWNAPGAGAPPPDPLQQLFADADWLGGH